MPSWARLGICFLSRFALSIQSGPTSTHFTTSNGTCAAYGGKPITTRAECHFAAEVLGFYTLNIHTYTCQAHSTLCGNGGPSGCFREASSLLLIPDPKGECIFWGSTLATTRCFCAKLDVRTSVTIPTPRYFTVSTGTCAAHGGKKIATRAECGVAGEALGFYAWSVRIPDSKGECMFGDSTYFCEKLDVGTSVTTTATTTGMEAQSTLPLAQVTSTSSTPTHIVDTSTTTSDAGIGAGEQGLWPEYHPKSLGNADWAKCVDWDSISYVVVSTRNQCQQLAITNAHDYYQYASDYCDDGDQGRCSTFASCDSPAIHDDCEVRIYKQVRTSVTTTTTGMEVQSARPLSQGTTTSSTLTPMTLETTHAPNPVFIVLLALPAVVGTMVLRYQLCKRGFELGDGTSSAVDESNKESWKEANLA